MRNKKIIITSIAALILSLTGCQSPQSVIIKEKNQTVTVPKSPQKIVVMNYGALDTLDALGKGSLVVGTSLPVLPTYLQQYKNAKVANTGNMKAPDLEAIKRTKPDLIIIDGRQAKQSEQLATIAPVLNLSVDSQNYVESTKNHINLLGKLTGSDTSANNLIQTLENKLNTAQAIAQASNKKAIVAIHNEGKVILINNSSSAVLIHDVLKVKRAVPLTQDVINPNERPKPVFIDNNYISKQKPDIIYIIDRSAAIGKEAMIKTYFDQKVLNKTKTNIVYLTADIWYLSGGGAESMARQIDEVTNALK